MDLLKTRPADNWSPLYFLASLGAGGLAVTFFMFLMFWVPHPNQPVPIFEDIVSAFQSGALPLQLAILLAWIGIAGFAFLNIRLLIWNLRQFTQFKKTEAYQRLMTSNAETQFLAMPLALAMTVNACFILGLVFVPGLWSAVEYLFPLAMVAFVAIAYLAFRRIAGFLMRVLTTEARFDLAANNSFAQLLPAFALSMAAVGLAAPVAMSTVSLTVGIGLVMSMSLGIVAVLYAAVAGIIAMISLLRHGAAAETAPTLMILVPLLTILGIMTMRQNHGLHTTFDAHGSTAESLMLTTSILAVQVVFIAFGMGVLKRLNYRKTYLRGEKSSVGSYALVCPGVALTVMMHFWINKGLVGAGLIVKFGFAYWGLTAIALGVQVAMILLVFGLNRQHFTLRSAPVAASSPIAAE